MTNRKIVESIKDDVAQVSKKAVNDGVIIGLEYALNTIDEYITQKSKQGYEHYLSRSELKILMTETIRLTKIELTNKNK